MNGMSSTIRDHLNMKHGELWRKVVVVEKLKGWETYDCSASNAKDVRDDSFSLDGFYRRLVCWIVVDDQVSILYIVSKSKSNAYYCLVNQCG